MSRTLHRVAWLLAILSTQPSVWGHHSVSAVFDQAKFITVTGTLTKVDWFNPHIAVIVDVAGTSGVETWKFQSSPPAWWKGVGVNRADFAKALGQPVTIGAYPSQDGSRYATCGRLRLPMATRWNRPAHAEGACDDTEDCGRGRRLDAARGRDLRATGDRAGTAQERAA